jgi:SOS-response transcriptional repressor LexA
VSTDALPPRAPLTAVERRLWHYLVDFLGEHTYQPSIREIGRHFKIPSTKTVTDLIGALERKGYLRREKGRRRGIVIEGFAGGAGTQPVPIVQLDAEHMLVTESYLTLDRSLLPADEAFLVRLMLEPAPAHAIALEDLVLVHPGARADEQTPVVARVGHGIVVRTIERRGQVILLRSAGAGTVDIELGPGDDFAVLGPLAGVFRSLARGRADEDDSAG